MIDNLLSLKSVRDNGKHKEKAHHGCEFRPRRKGMSRGGDELRSKGRSPDGKSRATQELPSITELRGGSCQDADADFGRQRPLNINSNVGRNERDIADRDEVLRSLGWEAGRFNRATGVIAAVVSVIFSRTDLRFSRATEKVEARKGFQQAMRHDKHPKKCQCSNQRCSRDSHYAESDSPQTGNVQD